MRPKEVSDWMTIDSDLPSKPDGSGVTMMRRVAMFHNKHAFSSEDNNGHDMGYRIALTIEGLVSFRCHH